MDNNSDKVDSDTNLLEFLKLKKKRAKENQN